MRETVLRVVERETGQAVTEATPLEDLGLDSLDLIHLLVAIADETGINFPDAKVASLETVGDIVAGLN